MINSQYISVKAQKCQMKSDYITSFRTNKFIIFIKGNTDVQMYEIKIKYM